MDNLDELNEYFSSAALAELVEYLENKNGPRKDPREPLEPKYGARLEALRQYGPEGATAEEFADSLGLCKGSARRILSIFMIEGYAGKRKEFMGKTYYVELEHAVRRAAPGIRRIAGAGALNLDTVFRITGYIGSKRPAVVLHILEDIYGPRK